MARLVLECFLWPCNFQNWPCIASYHSLCVSYVAMFHQFHTRYEAIYMHGSQSLQYKCLNLLQQTFKHTVSPQVKKLYLRNYRSCETKFIILFPCVDHLLIKDILWLERVQHLATNIILGDYIYSMDNKLRLKLLPLM